MKNRARLLEGDIEIQQTGTVSCAVILKLTLDKLIVKESSIS